MVKGYKIVKRDTLNSYIEDGGSAINYIFNEFVYPHEGCGPLAVFKNLEDAVDFWELDSYACIYECEFVESIKKMLWFPLVNGVIHYKTCEFPDGTYFADSVKILRTTEKFQRFLSATILEFDDKYNCNDDDEDYYDEDEDGYNS